MDWAQIGKISYQFLLSVIEWGLKICAFVAGLLALGAKGSFGVKFATGYGALSSTLRQLFEIPVTFKEISWAAREYQQVGRAEFQEVYGLAPIDQLVASLNGFFGFFNQISTNLSQETFISLAVTLLVFLSFYLLARVLRFARQRGRGSWFCRMEQRLGDRVFNRVVPDLPTKIRKASKQKSVKKKVEKSPPKPSYLKHIGS